MNLREFIHPIQNLNKLSQDGILLLNTDLTIEFQNTAFSRLTGFSSPQLKGRKLEFIFTMTGQKDLMKRLKTEKVLTTDLSVKLKNNKFIKSRAFFSLLEFEEEIIGVMLIMPKKLPQDEVSRYQLNTNPVMRAINVRRDYVWIVADVKTGHYLFCSESIRAITGWHSENFTDGGRPFAFSIFHPSYRERCFKIIAGWSLTTNQKKLIYSHLPLVLQFKLKKMNGEWIDLVGEANVLERNQEGEVVLVLWSFRKEREGLPGTQRRADADNFQDYIKFIGGKPYIDLQFLRLLQSRKAARIAQKKTEGDNFRLTERELQTLRMIADGLSSDEIASKIFISKHTVNLHRKQIMKKVGARNLAELIRIGIHNGLI